MNKYITRRNFKYEYLPHLVVNKLNHIISSQRDFRACNNYLLIVGLIYLKHADDAAPLSMFYPLSVQYWKTVIGSHYSKYISMLINEGVIQYDWVQYVSDCGDASRVKGYRISPELMTGELKLMKYMGGKNESVSSDEVFDEPEEFKHIGSGFVPEMISLRKNQALLWLNNGISEVIRRYKDSEYVTGIPPKMSVLIRIIYDEAKFSSHYMSVEAGIKIAGEQGKQFLYYKDKFVIAEEKMLDSVASKNLNNNYKWHITTFIPEKFNLIRNKKTLRVYGKLASLPSSLLQFVRINGNYVMQADLKCSQFMLFGNLLNYYINHSGDALNELFKKKQAKTFVKNLVAIFNKHNNIFPDEGLNNRNIYVDEYNDNNVYKFITDTLVNDFYSIIQTELNLPNRNHGKGIAFRTAFAKSKPENELVKQFRSIYPAIIEIINDFKNRYGYNQFSVGLQCVEAELFVDNIWKKVKDAGINSFTRHDSLIFPITKQAQVKNIIENVFNDFDFIFKIEYQSFNDEEINLRLVNETNYVDNMENEFDEVFFNTKDEAKRRANEEKFINTVQEKLLEAELELPADLKNDYFEDVTLDLLFVLIELDGLSLEIRLSLEEDIANLQSNYPAPSFNNVTNKFIKRLVELTDRYL